MNTTWSDGYVHDITYTHGYYDELNPCHLTIPFLMKGLAKPEIFHACELGFGQGLSVNIHAAAYRATWYATDFNPAQAANATHLANQAGTTTHKIHIADQSFGEFCNRDDLPEFDYIALHGIWSWVSDENRHIIVDFIKRKLKIGGVLYISYNTLPGWAAPSPIRHLLAEHDKMMTSPAQNKANSAKSAVAFSSEVINLSTLLIGATPSIKTRMDDLAEQNPHYLAHEYLNRDWQPMYFADMAKWLAPAKLSFACSANFLDDFDDVLFTAEQKQFLAGIGNADFYQTIKDYFVNKQFRKDYWVKGGLSLDKTEQLTLWHSLRVMLTTPPNKFNAQITGIQSITVLQELYEPILNILGDGKIHQVSDLMNTLNGVMSHEQVFTILAILIAKKDMVLCQNPSDETIAHSQKLNIHLLEKSQSHQEINYLASPITGGGVHYSYIERLFLLAHVKGVAQDGWVGFAWQILKNLNQNLIKDGQVLQSEDENIAELGLLRDEFLVARFDMAKRLMVVS